MEKIGPMSKCREIKGPSLKKADELPGVGPGKAAMRMAKQSTDSATSNTNGMRPGGKGGSRSDAY